MIYVACPVATDPDFKFKKAVLDRVSQSLGVELHFPLEAAVPRFIDTKIELERAQGVVADLSLERPSVYFELGLSAGLGIPIRLIAKTGSEIHQVTDEVIEFYDSLESYEAVIQRSLKGFQARSNNNLHSDT